MPIKFKQHPSKEYLNLNYYYDNGELYCKKTGLNTTKSLMRNGYIRVSIKYNNKYQQFAEHRLIYIYHNGDIPENMQIDHIDSIKINNKIENLRVLSDIENTSRAAIEKSISKSKIPGINWDSRSKSWRPYLRVNNKTVRTGYFKDIENAKKAKLELEIKHLTHRHNLITLPLHD